MNHGEPAGCCAPVETTAPISVTVNPEARVNVARTRARLGPMSVGDWHTVDVTIVNDGYVTGPLAIEAEPVPGVELDLPVHQLTGEHRQDGMFRVRFGVPTAADITLTFRALGALGGLATHSTIHLLLRSDTRALA
ncbi:hypothetical protein [Phytoactinopolyspora halotolerans]|uniref:DUF1573 domain-containing protein n=1 Tax=Phytoactinopolyspora halotolerans TaxID=1981512 RepID=A0A6L9S732_9ACTN|nr:hypothetical protein [Phytoactinopolyspora halotolerans]NEE00787.1 hypothetical protein [Phytoactinopolyspora halotolerans]